MTPFWQLVPKSKAGQLGRDHGPKIEIRKLWPRTKPPDKAIDLGSRAGVNSEVFASRDSNPGDPDTAIRVHVPPILTIGDAKFAHATRGHAATPNSRVRKTFTGAIALRLSNAFVLLSLQLSRFIIELARSTPRSTSETPGTASATPRAHVFWIREYHTSRLCRECHTTELKMVQSRFPGIERRRKLVWGVKSE